MEYTCITSCHFSTLAISLLLLWCHGCQCQEGQQLISGGSEANIVDVPYHVGIYINTGKPGEYKQHCGGTLISTTLVVTAAHCFWNEKTGTKNDTSLYMVAAGKTYRSWKNALNRRSVQKRKVAKLTLHKRYLGWAQNLANDIAIVTLDKPVKLTGSVGLADIDWEDVWTSEQLTHESNGTVAGWGITETGGASDTLLFVTLPYIDPEACFDSLRPNLKKFLTHDKFCVGFLQRKTSVCPGDSGGGLVYHHPGTGKHFLRGIVSLAFRPVEFMGKCYAQHYTAFTKVSPDVVRNLKTIAEQGASAREGECGRRGRVATPLIAGGQDAREAEFPWHVAVYLKNKSPEDGFRYVCGGSLISSDFVVSAPHCFEVVRTNTPKDAGLFRISAGAIKVSYQETANLPTVQNFGISHIAFHPLYAGFDKYYANSIALVRLDRPALFTPTVAPVCVDWNGAFSRDLRDGALGLVPGFGLDSAGTLANTLQWITLPYVNLTTCLNFARSISPDTGNILAVTNFCAGERNTGKALCLGDSGGSFSVLHSANQRYYLRGIVTTALRRSSSSGGCDTDGYTVIETIAAPYLDWMRSVISEPE